MPTSRSQSMQGGSASDFLSSFYASSAVGGPAAISRATLSGLSNSPMFNPLSATSVIPTGSLGIIPSGTYLASIGGGKSKKQPKVADLRKKCVAMGKPVCDSKGKLLSKEKLLKLVKRY